MTSPTACTLKWLRELGYTAEVVERFNPHSKTRKDLFNWIDLVAIGPAIERVAFDVVEPKEIIGLQVTSGSNHAARVTKARPLAQPWLDSGGLGYVISWAKQGPKGKRKVWKVRVEAL